VADDVTFRVIDFAPEEGAPPNWFLAVAFWKGELAADCWGRTREAAWEGLQDALDRDCAREEPPLWTISNNGVWAEG